MSKLASCLDEKYIIACRRHLHRFPELSGNEVQTAEFLAQELRSLGLEVTENISGHGLVALLPGNPAQKCVAMRADMDALPIEEATGLEFKSCNPGCMHACGHDAHMAVVLGIAKAFSGGHVGGDLKFIFQPREEKPPGGARDMVAAGVLNDPAVDVVLGFHVSPVFPAGTLGVRPGAIMALADDFYLTIKGKGGHGAEPHLAVDTVIVACEAILALQTVVSRLNKPGEPLVLSIGTINGGTAQNIIAEEVKLSGTLRCLNEEVRDKALSAMHRILDGLTSAWNAGYELDYLYGYPPVINNAALVDVLRQVSRREDIPLQEMPQSFMAGEDYAYYGQKVPGLYFMVGSADEKRKYPWHHKCFDINESCLKTGALAMLAVAAELSAQNK